MIARDAAGPAVQRLFLPRAATTIVFVLLAALVLNRAYQTLPPALWLQALVVPAPNVRELLLRDSVLPRLAVSLLAGGVLALAGTIFQQVLRNPLAEPTTLGVSAGAQFALAATLLWSPALYGAAQSWIALIGATGAFVLVAWLGAASGLSVSGLVVAGLVVSQICGALSAVLIVLNHDYLSALFIWQSGALAQSGWGPVNRLLAGALPLTILCGLLVRPLELMSLQEEGARSLGVPVLAMRIALLTVAAALSACVTSAVGVIGFIGLAAPAMARGLGARTLRQRLVWAPCLGAGLLALTDQILQATPVIPQQIPTGAATGLLGAPLLIWLVCRTRSRVVPPEREVMPARRLRGSGGRRLALGLALALIAALYVALAASHGPEGWRLVSWPEFESLSYWRLPRVLSAVACGVMLAVAGVLLQRMSGNPMASPEVLGVTSGATGAVILAMLLVPGFDVVWTFPVACFGATLTLAALLGLAGRSAFAPERLLLVGVALSSLVSALCAIALTSGDPRVSLLINWMSGSTYGVTYWGAGAVCVLALITLALAPLVARWLDILPLGASGAKALGVHLHRARLSLVLLAAIAASAATLIVGPLSFIGLMAPHMARMLGLERPLPLLFGAATLGALLMTLADWLGRTLFTPWQVPAGLIATVVGIPYFLWLMRRKRR